MKAIVVILVMLIIAAMGLTACGGQGLTVVPELKKLTSFNGEALIYYHDEVHHVGVWMRQNTGVFVLPDSEYTVAGD